MIVLAAHFCALSSADVFLLIFTKQTAHTSRIFSISSNVISSEALDHLPSHCFPHGVD